MCNVYEIEGKIIAYFNAFVSKASWKNTTFLQANTKALKHHFPPQLIFLFPKIMCCQTSVHFRPLLLHLWITCLVETINSCLPKI